MLKKVVDFDHKKNKYLTYNLIQKNPEVPKIKNYKKLSIRLRALRV